MLCIGIIGEKERLDTLDFLLHLYRKKGFYAKSVQRDAFLSSAILENEDAHGGNHTRVSLFAMHPRYLANRKLYGVKFHILIYLGGNLSGCDKNTRLSELLEEKNILIVNSDQKGFFPFFIGTGTTLITCGMNSKASVTASSVVSEYSSETIQCCIQRIIPTVSGAYLEPQEFAVSVSGQKKSVSGILAAVAAAAAVDTEISELNLSFL